MMKTLFFVLLSALAVTASLELPPFPATDEAGVVHALPQAACGSFDVPSASSGSSGVSIVLTFDLEPSCTSPECYADPIAYVQMVRISDPFGPRFEGDMADRMVISADPDLDGWAIDRRSAAVFGYYGMLDDGYFSWGEAIPGYSDAVDQRPAIMTDNPSGWSDGVIFEAVAVPVCLDGPDVCVPGVAGLYRWAFSIEAGHVDGPYLMEATAADQKAFGMAVDAWNAQVEIWNAEGRIPKKERLPDFFKPLP